MKPPGREGRPQVTNPGPAPSKITAASEITYYSLAALDALASHVDGGFAVLVQVSDDRWRRRVFLTVGSAEAHARKAQQRGQSARVFMVELRPLVRIVPAEPEPLPIEVVTS